MHAQETKTFYLLDDAFLTKASFGNINEELGAKKKFVSYNLNLASFYSK